MTSAALLLTFLIALLIGCVFIIASLLQERSNLKAEIRSLRGLRSTDDAGC